MSVIPFIPMIAGAIGSAVGNHSKNVASANADQAAQEQLQLKQSDEASQEAARAAQTQLAQRGFASSQSQLALKNALEGGLLKGTQDVTVTPPPAIAARMGTVTGGLRPSAISGGAGIGDALQKQALLNLMGPGSSITSPIQTTPVGASGGWQAQSSSSAAPSIMPSMSSPTAAFGTSGSPASVSSGSLSPFSAMLDQSQGLLSPSGNGFAGPGGTNLIQPQQQMGGLSKALGYILPALTAGASIYGAAKKPLPAPTYSTDTFTDFGNG